MEKLINLLKRILSKVDPKKIKKLQLLILLNALLEIFSVIMIVPFIYLITNPTEFLENSLVKKISEVIGVFELKEISIIYISTIIIVYLFSMLLNLYSIAKIKLISANIGIDISQNLFTDFLNNDFLFFTKNSNSELIKKINNDCTRFSANVITPLLTINAKAVTSLLIIFTLLIYNYMVTIILLIIFFLLYFLIFRFSKQYLVKYDKDISNSSVSRISILTEAFLGIQEVIIGNLKKLFLEKYNNESNKFFYAQAIQSFLLESPRFVLEMIIISLALLVSLYLFIFGELQIDNYLPILALYFLSAFKLIPYFQNIYSCLATIKGNIISFYDIEKDLVLSKSSEELKNDSVSDYNTNIKERLIDQTTISIKNVSFSYYEKLIFKDLNININFNKITTIYGKSGFGKTTLINLITGLLKPSKGSIEIGKIILNNKNIKEWHSMISILSQNFFLLNASIIYNIILENQNYVNHKKLNSIIRICELQDFISNLDHGLETKIGDNGIKLSGGQRQRIGLARSLYKDAEIYILDEATSAIDKDTEKKIYENIFNSFSKKTFINISHNPLLKDYSDHLINLDEIKF